MMTAAAMATMATVEAATTTPSPFPCCPLVKTLRSLARVDSGLWLPRSDPVLYDKQAVLQFIPGQTSPNANAALDLGRGVGLLVFDGKGARLVDGYQYALLTMEAPVANEHGVETSLVLEPVLARHQ